MGNSIWIHLWENRKQMLTIADHQDTASHLNLKEHGPQEYDAKHQRSYPPKSWGKFNI